ncbi:hypothetical protein SUGI_0903500 [Cryptomeria japonica]|uniref:uncharacterized protein LOC131059300 n=1 Tax=Cryptomeria japonica TaxID=3369 RepID=UPI002414A12B|nr:uncharacterized protein LOC131059300 [Cryptomeria japonica]GLJ43455.1 hypothetical protein SUGI_0903500 [Cryptomeria japonica]
MSTELKLDLSMASDEEDEEAPSLCDLPQNGRAAYERSAGDSNRGCSEPQDFNFDLGSMAYQACPADDLFCQGRLLPLTLQRCRSESNAQLSYGKSNSCSENRRLLNEKLQAWRIDPLESRSNFWTYNSQASRTENYNSQSDRNIRRANSAAAKSKSKPNRSSSASQKPPPPPSGSKTSLKWQQVLTLGLLKAPAIKLEEMHVRQWKPYKNGTENPTLKRSVSCNYQESLKLGKTESKDLPFRQKSKSVKENRMVEGKERSKGWRMFAPLTSLNGFSEICLIGNSSPSKLNWIYIKK